MTARVEEARQREGGGAGRPITPLTDVPELPRRIFLLLLGAREAEGSVPPPWVSPKGTGTSFLHRQPGGKNLVFRCV